MEVSFSYLTFFQRNHDLKRPFAVQRIVLRYALINPFDMEIAINILIGLIAMIHIYILWFEMFAWTTRGRKVFTAFPAELFEQTKTLAANQGLYNGFLAAGLIWTFFISDELWRDNVALFFLGCVAVAGIYGAISAERKIFFVQALPALIAILLIVIA